MTNAQKFLQTDPYDLLCRIQDYMGKDGCVIEAIDIESKKNLRCDFDCCNCIESWLYVRRDTHAKKT